MKFMVTILVFLFSASVFAVDFMSDTGVKVGTSNRIKCDVGLGCVKDANGLMVLTTSVEQRQVTASTTALTAAQCGATVTSAGAVVQPLPEASTVRGCRYTFRCGTADDFDIDPADGTDVIGRIYSVTGSNTTTVINPSAGDEIRCTDVDAVITLEATGDNLWSPVTVGSGAWTDVN